jgi:hypothetical protein
MKNNSTGMDSVFAKFAGYSSQEYIEIFSQACKDSSLKIHSRVIELKSNMQRNARARESQDFKFLSHSTTIQAALGSRISEKIYLVCSPLEKMGEYTDVQSWHMNLVRYFKNKSSGQFELCIFEPHSQPTALYLSTLKPQLLKEFCQQLVKKKISKAAPIKLYCLEEPNNQPSCAWYCLEEVKRIAENLSSSFSGQLYLLKK